MRDIVEEILACRANGGVPAGRRALLQYWQALLTEVARVAERDAAARARSPFPESGTGTLMFIEHIQQRFREAMPAVAEWPELGLAVLDEPELARWRPALIAEIARHEPLRPAMIERALALAAEGVELIVRFTELGAAERDRRLVDAAATLLDNAWGRRMDLVADLAIAYADLGDLATAERLALEGAFPLFALLRHTRCPMPEAGYEVLARIADDHDRTAAVTRLAELGYAREAERLAELLLTQGRGAKSVFAKPMAMATASPEAALDIVEGLVRAATTPIGIAFMMELARFLETVAVTPATTPRLRALAERITVRPMREAILARAKG